MNPFVEEEQKAAWLKKYTSDANRHSMDTRQETTLANVRLHWGIFIPAFFILFALSLPVLPIMVFLKFTANFASQLNPQAAQSNPWIIWFALIPDIVIFGIVLLATWIAYLKSEIRLTSKRLIFRTGLLSRMSGELPLENVESIFIIEPFIGRLCGYGTVTVTSIGGRAFPLRYIGSPQTFHATLQNAVASAKTPPRMTAKPPVSPQPPQDDDSRFVPKG
jgi:uncharacterized membrane protein YdbT with pleckstrin-like domain